MAMYHNTWWDKKRNLWMVQVVIDWQLSLGIHIDFRRRYIDIHLLWAIISFGINAPYSDHFNRFRWDSRGGKITYETNETDFDETGTWILQGWETDEFNRVNFGQSYSLKISTIPTWVDESSSI